MIPFGDVLQRLRTDRGWSQAQLADRLSISPSQIANYELGRRFPSLQALIDISRIFGVTTDYMLGLSTRQDHWMDVSDLTPDEVAAVSAVIECYRKLHKR